MLNNLEKQINDTLYTYKATRARQCNTIEQMRMDLKAGEPLENTAGETASRPHRAKPHKRTHSLNKSLVPRQEGVPAEARSGNLVKGLQQENATLVNKLNKARARNAGMKEELQKLRRDFVAKCDELAAKEQKFDQEVTTLRSYQVQLQDALKAQNNSYGSEMASNLATDLSDLRCELKKKEIELGEQALANKRLRDEIAAQRDKEATNVTHMELLTRSYEFVLC